MSHARVSLYVCVCVFLEGVVFLVFWASHNSQDEPSKEEVFHDDEPTLGFVATSGPKRLPWKPPTFIPETKKLPSPSASSASAGCDKDLAPLARDSKSLVYRVSKQKNRC